MIELDGALGEGGGQILRTSLTLAMITGQPFRIRRIRAHRSRPGLMRQHLVAVQAASRICGGQASGAALGSQDLTFIPGPLRGGDYRFDIGSAGSCTLVLQTVLPALLKADTPSTLHLSGGTHNPMAPPLQFLQRAWCPRIAEMGAQVEVTLERFGFYPAGGGEVSATVHPCARLAPRTWMARGAPVAAYAESFTAAIPDRVGQCELDAVGAAMQWQGDRLRLRSLPPDQGPGNALMLTFEHAHVTEVFTAFGEKKVRAEDVAQRVAARARRYLDSGAAVAEYLGDQLMLPLALSGGGGFTVDEISLHARTNAQVIELFLPVRFRFERRDGLDACMVEPC